MRLRISEKSRVAIGELLAWAQQANLGDEHVYYQGRTPTMGHDLVGLFHVVREMSGHRGINGQGYWFVSQRIIETDPDGAAIYAYTIRAISKFCWIKLEALSPDLGPIYA